MKNLWFMLFVLTTNLFELILHKRPDKTDPTQANAKELNTIKAWQGQPKPKSPQTGILQSALFPSSCSNGS